MKRKFYKGFTLVELMVTLAVVFIVMGVGIPLFSSMQANSRALTLSNSIVTALNLARNEAVGQNISVSVCAQASTVGSCTSGAWSNGWIVFHDVNADGTIDTGDELVKVWDRPANGSTITTTGNALFVTFNSRGAQSSSANTVQFKLEQAQAKSNQTRYVCVSVVGQVRSGGSACP